MTQFLKITLQSKRILQTQHSRSMFRKRSITAGQTPDAEEVVVRERNSGNYRLAP